MDTVGYFFMWANLQAIGVRSPDLNDVSVKIANLSTLANYLKNYPGFNVRDFRENQVSDVGDIGMYLSNDLRKFCLNGEGNAKDEGVIITFTYKIRGTSEDDKKKPNFANQSFLIRKEGLSDETIRPLLEHLHKHYSGRNRFFIIKDPKQQAYTNKYIV